MYLWLDFLALCGTRQMGMSANPISYVEIEAYARLTDTKYSKLELIVIKRLDALFLKQGQKDES